jgi:ribosomal protein S2
MSREAMIDQLNQESKKAMTEEKMADRLLKLAETFKLMSGKRQVIDVEVVDPQPDQENVTEAVLEALPVTDSTPG